MTENANRAVPSEALLALLDTWRKDRDADDQDGADAYERGSVNALSRCISDVQHEIRKANVTNLPERKR